MPDKGSLYSDGDRFYYFDGGKWVPVESRHRIVKPFLTYVAGPYTTKVGTPVEQAAVRAARFQLLTIAAVMLTDAKRWNCFSPITHSHSMHELGLGGDWEFWKKIDTEYIQASERLVIVTLDGWEQSTGVTAETKIANELSVPIFHMTAPELRDDVWHAWLTDNHAGEYLTYKQQ